MAAPAIIRRRRDFDLQAFGQNGKNGGKRVERRNFEEGNCTLIAPRGHKQTLQLLEKKIHLVYYK